MCTHTILCMCMHTVTYSETMVPNIIKNEKDHGERAIQQEEFPPSHHKDHLLASPQQRPSGNLQATRASPRINQSFQIRVLSLF